MIKIPFIIHYTFCMKVNISNSDFFPLNFQIKRKILNIYLTILYTPMYVYALLCAKNQSLLARKRYFTIQQDCK